MSPQQGPYPPGGDGSPGGAGLRTHDVLISGTSEIVSLKTQHRELLPALATDDDRYHHVHGLLFVRSGASNSPGERASRSSDRPEFIVLYEPDDGALAGFGYPDGSDTLNSNGQYYQAYHAGLIATRSYISSFDPDDYRYYQHINQNYHLKHGLYCKIVYDASNRQSYRGVVADDVDGDLLIRIYYEILTLPASS